MRFFRFLGAVFLTLAAIGLLSFFWMSPAHAYQLYTPAGVVEVTYVNTEGLKQTYSVVAPAVAPAAAATDVLVLTGSATKAVRISRIQVTGAATATADLDFYVYKRTALDTAGTATLPTIAKHDTSNATATATAKLYSANPTSVGAGSIVRADHFAMPSITSPTFRNDPWITDFGVRNDQKLVLRGVNESLAFGLNGQTVPAGTLLFITIEWTEE